MTHYHHVHHHLLIYLPTHLSTCITTGELEQLKASMHDDFAKVKFQLSEMEAHTSMLDTENKQLRHEIASMTGDMDTSSTVTASTKSAVSNANIRRPVSLDIVDDDNASIASSIPYKGTRQQQTKANNNNNIVHNNTRVSMSSSSGSLHQQQQQQHHHNINSTTHDDPERLLSETQRKDLIDDVSTNFLALCSEHNIDDDLTTIVSPTTISSIIYASISSQSYTSSIYLSIYPSIYLYINEWICM